MNSFEAYIKEMKIIHEVILKVIDNDDYNNEDEDELNKQLIKIDNMITKMNKYQFKEVLYIISKVSKHHHRSQNFHNKIDIIIKYFKDKIKEQFSNIEIFQIFKGNKRVLLFLFEEKILIPDESILSIITKPKYAKRFYPEYFCVEFNLINQNEENIEYESFQQKRKKGENDSIICQLIQNDSITEFIQYVNQTNYPLNGQIKLSIFETNTDIIEKQLTLIEYATFFGSIQIFQYLIMNEVKMKPSLWKYAIYSNNAEIIQFLEEKDTSESFVRRLNYRYMYKKSIKCHHIDIMNYYLDNHNIYEYSYSIGLKNRYYNFLSMEPDYISFKYAIDDFIKYNCICTVEHLINNNIVNPNEIIQDYRNSIKYPLLHYAIKNKNIIIIEMLLNHQNIDTNKYFIYGNDSYITKMPALFYTIENNDIETLKLLISNPKINIDKKLIIEENNCKIEKSLLYFAVEKENINIVKFLLENDDIDVNSDSIKTIHKSKNKYITQIKTALYEAVEIGNIEIIKLLLKQKNIKSQTRYVEYLNTIEYKKYKKRGKSEKEEKKIIKQLLSQKTLIEESNEKGFQEITSILIQHYSK